MTQYPNEGPASQRLLSRAQIHQPTPATFALFDKLLLMADGRTCFFGDVSDAPEYVPR